MPTPFFVVLLGVAGLAVGSFLNVCIDRLPTGRSIISVPSHCEACQRRLGLLDLAPVLSYLWLRGRCRYCRVPIPLRLPVVELAGGVLFGAVWYAYGPTVQALALLGFISVLAVVFFIDLEHKLILDKVAYPSIAAALAAVPWGPVGQGMALRQAYLDAGAGAALGGGVLLVIFLLARGGFGFGDVKLGVLLGLMLGFTSTLVALELSFIVGGVVAASLLVLRVRGGKDPVPFGPFLAGAGMVSLFWGETVAGWYQGLLFG